MCFGWVVGDYVCDTLRNVEVIECLVWDVFGAHIYDALVDDGAGLDDGDEADADGDRQSGCEDEIGDEADADFFQEAEALAFGDAEDDGADNQRDDDHLDEAKKDNAR